jgi:hypothetical protein
MSDIFNDIYKDMEDIYIYIQTFSKLCYLKMFTPRLIKSYRYIKNHLEISLILFTLIHLKLSFI